MSSLEYTKVKGVLFSRSIRSTFASLLLIPQDESIQSVQDGNSDDRHDKSSIILRIQFFGEVKDLRSFCRKAYKLGDLIEIRGGRVEEKQQTSSSSLPGDLTQEFTMRYVIDISSQGEAEQCIKVAQHQYWTMNQWQRCQNLYLSKKTPSNTSIEESSSKRQRQDEHVSQISNIDKKKQRKKDPHGGGLGKRRQGLHIAKFLIASIMQRLLKSKEDGSTFVASPAWLSDPKLWSSWKDEEVVSLSLYKEAIAYLNSGNGVLDVAGGSGHVSMALGLLGVKSTVVDARESVGKLPGRDRKVWKRAIQHGRTFSNLNSSSSPSNMQCQPVVPFSSFRAWFGARPIGVDSTFRHPDEKTLPICDEESTLLNEARAIVALHPDEATGEAIRLAAKLCIPFVAVPCCVFARIFPERSVVSTSGLKTVSSYDDLLLFLKNYHSSILQSELPFDGKNTVLWSTFDKKIASANTSFVTPNEIATTL